MSSAFWLVMIVMAMLMTAIFTAGYNDDKTAGL
jgi:Mg2+ and Co2+ transporter CorA